MKYFSVLVSLVILSGCENPGPTAVATQAYMALSSSHNALPDFSKTLTKKAKIKFANEETMNRLRPYTNPIKYESENAKLLSSEVESSCFWSARNCSAQLDTYTIDIFQKDRTKVPVLRLIIECKEEWRTGSSKQPGIAHFEECRISNIIFGE